MTRVKKSFMIFVLLFSLIACSQKLGIPSEADVTPTFTPWVGGTETALAVPSPTPWIAGTETALAVRSPTPPPVSTLPPLPTFTPPAFEEGTFSPVLSASKDSGSFLLVGGIKKDQGWLSAVQAAQFISNEMDYDFFSPNGAMQVRVGVPEFEPPCGNYVMRSSIIMPETMIGVASGWIPEKRGTRDLSTDDPAYVQAVAEWFRSQGNSPAEIHISRILQVDIEGDGVHEVLLSASYFKPKFAFLTETGDYSVVLMRKVFGNNVLTVPLVKDYYVSSVPEYEISYPYTYMLAEALDLNGDGTLEVIVHASRWEGGGVIVFRVDGQNVREIIRTIC